MKRGFRREAAIWGPVALVLFAAIIAGNIGNEITGAVVYRDSYGYGSYGGFFSGGFYSFTQIYYQYASLIDAAIFLLIFLSLCKVILGKQFKEGGKALYVGVGILLAFSLLMWEENTGFRIIEVLGPYVVLLMVVAALVWFFKSFTPTKMGFWLTILVSSGLYALIYSIIVNIPGLEGFREAIINFFYYSFNINNIFDTLLIVAVSLIVLSSVACVFGYFFKKIKGGN